MEPDVGPSEAAIEAAARGIPLRLRLAHPLTPRELVAGGCGEDSAVRHALARLQGRGQVEQLGQTLRGEWCWWTPAQAAAERSRRNQKA